MLVIVSRDHPLPMRFAFVTIRMVSKDCFDATPKPAPDACATLLAQARVL
jgi:hypothetical protein